VPERPSGLEELRGRLTSASAAPFYETAGVRVVEVAAGVVTAELWRGPELTDAAGRLLPGLAAAVADSALGASVYSLLPAGLASQTVELRLDFLPGIAGPTRRLVSHGAAYHLGHTTGFSRGDITDEAGAIRAYATLRAVVKPWEETDSPPSAHAGPPAVTPPLPTASALGSQSEATSPADLDGFLGSPLSTQLGLTLEQHDEREVLARIPVSSALANLFGIVHGGAVSMFAEVGVAAALHASLPRGTSFAVLDLAVNFLRPVPVAGSVDCHAELVHGSRRFAVVRAEVRNPGGRVAALASATVLLAGASSAG
jgi:uncharacterized protein (TIGR00369 family)